jgi:hypothetical protein
VQPIVLYFRPFKRPLNYLEYKKNYDPDVHVRVFKAAIKVNNETTNEEIKNMFNFTLKNNAFNWFNNYIRSNPNYRYADLEQVFCK